MSYMPVIRVSQEAYDKLATLRRGFETAGETFERVMNERTERAMKEQIADVAPSPKPAQAPMLMPSTDIATYHPQAYYREPLVLCLHDMGGKAPAKAIRKALESNLPLGPGDHAKQGSGAIRWWNFTQWQRQALVDEGLFRDDSRHGVWELSAEGKKYAESLRTPRHKL